MVTRKFSDKYLKPNLTTLTLLLIVVIGGYLVINSFKNKMFSKNDLEQEMTNWIKVVSVEKMPEGIKAVNFGLFQTKEGYAVYLIGSRSYDENNADWALNEDFVPQRKYFYIKDKELSSLKWNDFLTKIIHSLQKIVKTDQFRQSSLAKIEHITVGFDDGDLTVIK